MSGYFPEFRYFANVSAKTDAGISQRDELAMRLFIVAQTLPNADGLLDENIARAAFESATTFLRVRDEEFPEGVAIHHAGDDENG